MRKILLLSVLLPLLHTLPASLQRNRNSIYGTVENMLTRETLVVLR